ncbi:MAG: hypothetical protein GIW97_06275 [Candidatus Eremiobacteraeota bacterium]|nr:hypothetical protein [Candidatus Eremiobacteraeota bacterium]
MTHFSLLLGLSIAATTPTPAAPVPEIGHVETSALCSALNAEIGHSIQGILLNDRVIDASGLPMRRMAADLKDGSSRFLLDKSQLRELITKGTHNVEVIENLLGGLAAAHGSELEKIKQNLAAVVHEQNASFDALNGMLDTYDMEDLQNRPDLLRGAAGKELVVPAGLPPLSAPAAQIPGGPTIIANNLSAPGFIDSPFALFARVVLDHQTAASALERNAAAPILQAARRCNSPR